jgi:hypothetical protein
MYAKMSFLTLSTIALLAHSVVAAPRLYARDTSCPGANGTVLTASNGNTFMVECGVDRWGGDLPAPNGQSTSSLDNCVASCIATTGCISVQWADGSACYLKGTLNAPTPNANVWGAVPVQVNTVTVPVIPVSSAEASPAVAQKAHVSVTPPAASTPAVAAPSSIPSSYPSAGAPSGGCIQPKALSSKRGISYNDASMAKFFGSKITWAYNWGSSSDGLTTSLDYAPMLWGEKFVSGWSSIAQAAVASGADTLLGFNEPDLPAQSDLTVDAAVTPLESSDGTICVQGSPRSTSSD